MDRRIFYLKYIFKPREFGNVDDDDWGGFNDKVYFTDPSKLKKGSNGMFRSKTADGPTRAFTKDLGKSPECLPHKPQMDDPKVG